MHSAPRGNEESKAWGTEHKLIVTSQAPLAGADTAATAGDEVAGTLAPATDT